MPFKQRLPPDDRFRGQGIGKQLTQACIQKGSEKKKAQVIIHTTKTMQIAWKMHKGFRFTRSEDLDFMQGNLKVYGFHLRL
jgi:ribosomal protein S18 acetylase RimI-like enzyme